jgi:FtsH-binding integral membrane protein
VRNVRERNRRAARLQPAGLGIFAAFTIFDFNRLRQASPDGAVVIASSIFLDIFNVFVLLLGLFGGNRD